MCIAPPKHSWYILPSTQASRSTWSMCDDSSTGHGSQIDYGGLQKHGLQNHICRICREKAAPSWMERMCRFDERPYPDCGQSQGTMPVLRWWRWMGSDAAVLCHLAVLASALTHLSQAQTAFKVSLHLSQRDFGKCYALLNDCSGLMHMHANCMLSL